jgi:Uncharacterized protein, similar to the N-terminal domain of Lon protease
MQGELLPLFPLEVVLFPRTSLALHIFEERYRQLVADVVAAQSEFGIVLAREQGIVNVGCTATVEMITRRYEDGRLDILTRGRRRFEIRTLDDEKPYIRASVEIFDDDDFTDPPPQLKDHALSACLALRDAVSEQGPEPELDDPQLSFQLAQVLPDLDFLQVLLRSRSEAERLKMLAERVPAYVARARYVAQVRRTAPFNGHGRGRNQN